MPEFTPGPWHIYEDEDGSLWQEDRDVDGYHVVNDDGEFVARVVGLPPPGYTDPDDGMLAANARLMAAAPEMLDILRRIVAAPVGAHYGELIRRGYHLLERLGERPMPVEELRAESRQREKEHPDA